MKRSAINQAFREASECFARQHWALPPAPRWDITDFGLGDFCHYGLTLINLSEELEYCEKLMYASKAQITPAHAHVRKKEDIICRSGQLTLELWAGHPQRTPDGTEFAAKVNGQWCPLQSGEKLRLEPGERITLTPNIYHSFWASADDTIIGEVSTANDDDGDNLFVDPGIGRFPGIEEDEAAQVRLISEGQA